MSYQVGFYRGDVLTLLEDVEELQPTMFMSVPRLYNRIYDKVRGTAACCHARCSQKHTPTWAKLHMGSQRVQAGVDTWRLASTPEQGWLHMTPDSCGAGHGGDCTEQPSGAEAVPHGLRVEAGGAAAGRPQRRAVRPPVGPAGVLQSPRPVRR